MTVKLSPSQQNVLDEVFSFIMSDEPALVITGEAGTGKSFVSAQIIRELPIYLKSAGVAGFTKYSVVHLAAPTNKAVENLQEIANKLSDDERKIIGNFGTVHKLFGIGFDFVKRESVWSSAKPIEDAVILIDEMPMISTYMLKTIMRCTKASKVIFIGDDNQLPPVDEKPDMMGKINIPVMQMGFRQVSLTDQMRQKSDSPLYDYIGKVCDCVRFNKPADMSLLNSVPGITFANDACVTDALNKLYDPSTGYLDLRVLCYTNNSVGFWNKNIREFLKIPVVPRIGDCVNTIYGRGVVTECKKKEEHPIDVTSTQPVNLTYYTLTVEVGKRIVTPTIVAHPGRLKRLLAQRAALEKAGKVMPDSLTTKLQRLSTEIGRESTIDMSQAMTVHKSQGSTYNNVLIDLTDFAEYAELMGIDTLRRLMYVAVSRAKQNVIFYGDFPKVYFEEQ